MNNHFRQTSFWDYLRVANSYRNFEWNNVLPVIKNICSQNEHFFSNMPFAATLLDFTERRYVFMSESIASILGYSANQMVTGGIDFVTNKIYQAKDVEIYAKNIFPENLAFLKSQPVGQHQNFVFSYNWRGKNAAGENVNILQHSFMIQSADDGSPLLMLNLAFDISDFSDGSKIIHTITNTQSNQKIWKNTFWVNIADSMLTKRELEVLKWVCEGLSSKQIADKMFLSVHTIINHRKNMLEKTNSNNTAELLKFAIQNRVL